MELELFSRPQLEQYDDLDLQFMNKKAGCLVGRGT